MFISKVINEMEVKVGRVAREVGLVKVMNWENVGKCLETTNTFPP